jgi:hypothetical protein
MRMSCNSDLMTSCGSGEGGKLLETVDGFVIIDHKTFPGAPNSWIEKAKEFSPQLALYSQMVAQAAGRPYTISFTCRLWESLLVSDRNSGVVVSVLEIRMVR